MRFILIALLILVSFFWPGNIFSQDLSFAQKLAQLKWVAYAPTNFDAQKPCYPDELSLREDLLVLKGAGLNGLITYGAEDCLAQIPRIAKEVGFAGVIMGIWSPQDLEEIKMAISQKDYVDGYCLGNEGCNERYDIKTLGEAIYFIKSETAKPVTTTEQIGDYFYNQDLVEAGDWLFPNVHPFLHGMRKPKFAASWTQDRYRALKSHLKNKKLPILFKECGYPTAGISGASEETQEAFFSLLEKTDVPFVYFEAFDQPWKRHLPCEPHWGLFEQNRNPKKFIRGKIAP